MNSPILPILLAGPVILAIILALMPKESAHAQKMVAVIGTIVLFIVSLGLYTNYNAVAGGYQMNMDLPWITAGLFKTRFFVGVDGISMVLIILTTLLTPISLLASWTNVEERAAAAGKESRLRDFLVFMLLLETGLIGVFAARDLFLFYTFWEFQLIPMYFLIGMFGGENRLYATIKFVLYTLVGSLLMLVAIMWVWSYGGHTFDIAYLSANLQVPHGIQTWLFLAFALAFAIKVPMFPLHTWLPDAHTEAPTAGSVMLAGVLLKMGTYGFLRFCFPFFPNAAHDLAPLFIVLAVIGIVYGAIVSAVQPDFKRLVAYSSVSHLGFVMLGLFAFNQIGWQGAVIQMVNHGVSTGALFLCVGILYDQRHTRLIREFGGVANVMPMFYVVFLISLLSSVGLPALNGFIGEFSILLGAFQSYPIPTFFATSGVILAAVYLLWMFQRIMQGKPANEHVLQMKDLNPRQMAYLAPLLILMVGIGLFPNMIFHKTQAAVATTLMSSDLKAQENVLLRGGAAHLPLTADAKPSSAERSVR
jgi:NADH-quinone oxidoreductase subunit M